MNKEFLPYNVIRNNALKLAKRVFDDGFMPDVIYVPLRGGAYMGNVFSEFFKIVNKKNRPVFYAAVVARSYTDIHLSGRVRIDGWTYDPEYLRNGDRVLFVDDIFDTGRTLNHLLQKSNNVRLLNRISGTLMIGVGIWLAVD
jgi:hypoxanthine phosphoribosyltransferase